MWNVLQVTYRRTYNVSGPFGKLLGTRCDNVAGTSCMLLEEVASYLQKMWQRIWNVLQGTWRVNVAGTSCKLLKEDVKRYKGHLAHT